MGLRLAAGRIPHTSLEDADEDERDLEALYQILIHEAIPTYYQNRPNWIEMMRASKNGKRLFYF